MATYRVGTSGFSYEHWRSDFYPEGLSQARWLEYYAERFDTVEINASFYRMPAAKTVQAWASRTPPSFRFTFKASRHITHVLRLRDAHDAVAAFLGRIQHAGLERLGAVLYQVPPYLHRDDALLADFLAVLPAGFEHVFEFRHASWFSEDILAMLDHAGAGFCVHDMLDAPCPIAVTGPSGYFRFHGPGHGYNAPYSDDELSSWADRIRNASRPNGVTYVYFNNDLGGHAPRNALLLREMLTG